MTDDPCLHETTERTETGSERCRACDAVFVDGEWMTIDELIEGSSLGTPEARRHRRNTPPEVRADVLARLENENATNPENTYDPDGE